MREPKARAPHPVAAVCAYSTHRLHLPPKVRARPMREVLIRGLAPHSGRKQKELFGGCLEVDQPPSLAATSFAYVILSMVCLFICPCLRKRQPVSLDGDHSSTEITPYKGVLDTGCNWSQPNVGQRAGLP